MEIEFSIVKSKNPQVAPYGIVHVNCPYHLLIQRDLLNGK